MTDWKSSDRHMILSSDAHAGAAPAAEYRNYLSPQWHAEFDTWLASIVNPWADMSDARNSDSGDRLAAMENEGVTGEVLFPNMLPPFYDILAHLSGVPLAAPATLCDVGPAFRLTIDGLSTSATERPPSGEDSFSCFRTMWVPPSPKCDGLAATTPSEA